jgi:hypothetical protein
MLSSNSERFLKSDLAQGKTTKTLRAYDPAFVASVYIVQVVHHAVRFFSDMVVSIGKSDMAPEYKHV